MLCKRTKYYIKRSIGMFNHLRNSTMDRSAKILILTYHRILPKVKFNPLNTIISLRIFHKQIDKLVKKYDIVSLSEAVNQCKIGSAKAKIQIVLTFDDGYQDNYEVVYPILKQKGLPATYFIAPDYIGIKNSLWDYEIFKILYNNRNLHKINIGGKDISQNIFQSRLFFIFSIIERIKSLDSNSRQKFLEIFRNEVQEKEINDYLSDKCMTWDQIEELSLNDMEIGSHGLTHSSLARIPFDEAVQEITRSKEIIENNIKKKCIYFAFPFGSKKDYNSELIDYIKNAGYQACLLNTHGYNHIKKDAFCFRRIIMEDTTNLDYLLG